MKQCEVNGCKRPAKWGLYKTFPNGEKRWLRVCDGHEKEIGQKNLQRAGGRVIKSRIKGGINATYKIIG